jgi:hypothetical protein
MASEDDQDRERREREERERAGQAAATDAPGEGEDRPDDLTDELAKKYDPARLMKSFAGRAGRGSPLEHSVRSRYERRFGVDLGHVRIYSGEFAEEFNRQRNAYAVTVGGTGMIMMGNSPDRSMGSAAGQALLAHELTHVAQQARGLHRKSTFADAMPFAAEHEEEADRVEQAVFDEEMGKGHHLYPDDAHQAQMLMQARQKAQDKLQETHEQVKQRVLDMMGDVARNQGLRNGSARRA